MLSIGMPALFHTLQTIGSIAPDEGSGVALYIIKHYLAIPFEMEVDYQGARLERLVH